MGMLQVNSQAHSQMSAGSLPEHACYSCLGPEDHLQYLSHSGIPLQQGDEQYGPRGHLKLPQFLIG